MRVRDAEVARMRALNVPFRLIGSRLGMSLDAVQKSVRRSQKLADASGEARRVLAAVDDEMDAEDVASAADVEKLNVLERYRLRHVPGAFGDAERAASPGSPPGSTGTPASRNRRPSTRSATAPRPAARGASNATPR